MGLALKSLELTNFRNHKNFIIDDAKKLIIIIGKNASGKTNIIEALQLLTATRSFRGSKWENCVNNESIDTDNTVIEITLYQNERKLDIQMIIKDGKRTYFLNQKKKNINEICGLVPGVIFIPDDLNLIKNSSEARRELIDDIGQQLSKTYLAVLNDYKKTVKQRNSILKELKETNPYIDHAVLESWNENLIKLGATLYILRVKLYKKLCKNVEEQYLKLSTGECLSSRYIPSFHSLCGASDVVDTLELKKENVEAYLREYLKNVEEEERARCKTLVGPHKDEINFYINGLDARQFASQGQQRSIALALKLGQLTLVKEISGNQPILLLDDVMSELDESRRNELIKVIQTQNQTVITATDLKNFNKELLVEAQIIKLDQDGVEAI